MLGVFDAAQQNGHWGSGLLSTSPGAAREEKPVIGPRRGSQRRDTDDSSNSPSPSPDIGSMSISGPPSRTVSGVASPDWKWKSGGGPPAAERRPMDGELFMPWPRLAEKQYQLIRSVGSGSFGEVFQARRLSDGKIVAVKVMEKDGWALEEASLLRELDHECICKLYDSFECPEENVTCGDLLARIIQSGPLTERTATDIVRQLLQALKYMHDKGVIHRDLKPDNILYSSERNGRPLLADFGVSKKIVDQKIDDLAQPRHEDRKSDPQREVPAAPAAGAPGPAAPVGAAGAAGAAGAHDASARFVEVSRSRYIGTVGYSAPEVNSSAGHSFAADVWSFGAMVYVLLCGHHPFDYGDDEDEVISERVRKGEVLPMEGENWQYISKEAVAFIAKCLVVDVAERATVDECLAHPWLSMDTQRDVVELVDAFVKLKMLHSMRQERKREASISVASSREASVALLNKRKREVSVTSDD
ncbi:kinase-like domain-containing protein, partial [Baffinella frigidus]